MTVVIHVDAPVGQAIGVKEQLAMYLERFGNAKVVLVTEKEPEQLGLEGFERRKKRWACMARRTASISAW